MARKLWYTQTPVVSSSDACGEPPAGLNLTFACTTFQGNGMEDCIVISEACLQRGLFRYDVERRTHNPSRGDTLDKDGAPCPGVLRQNTCCEPRYGPATVVRSCLGLEYL